MIQLRSTFALTLILGIGAFAQEVRVLHAPPGGAGETVTLQVNDFTYVRTEFATEGKVVKGSPYSAQAVTEFTQTLGDGNRIHRITTGSIVRDSEGRTRREQAITAIGPLATSGDVPKSVFIHDPVAGVSYTLEPGGHVARRMAEAKKFKLDAAQPAGQALAREKEMRSKLEGALTELRSRQEDERTAKEYAERIGEELGTQAIEGVPAQGKRITRTIPAGQIGNDRAIQIVTETWYSPDLQAVVLSKTSDPRSGDTVYKLTGISRAEPDRSLFEVPADYTVKEGKENVGFTIRRDE